MAPSPWETPEFWGQKAHLLRAAARRWGRPDHREAIGTVWLKLRTRFPDGTVPGTHPVAYLNRTIWAEAGKVFRQEVKRRTRLAARPIHPIGPSDDRPSRAPAPEEELIRREVGRAVDGLLRDLPEQDRLLIEARYGVGREAVAVKDIAKTLQLSPQAVGKRLRRVLETLRARARRTKFAV
jgi:RNA polymerase sigma factor (sigma-70 family)